MELYFANRFADAVPHFSRAYELDTTFLVALGFEAFARANLAILGNLPQAVTTDSVVGVIANRRDELSDYHHLLFDYLGQTVRGENEVALRTIRRAAELAPGSKAVYNVAWTALRTGRLEEAVEAL